MIEFTQIDKTQLEELRKLKNTQIVDIREVWEFRDFNIGGINVPAHEINDYIETLSKYDTLIVVCSNGTRGNILARVFAKKLPKVKVYHLEEGIY